MIAEYENLNDEIPTIFAALMKPYLNKVSNAIRYKLILLFSFCSDVSSIMAYLYCMVLNDPYNIYVKFAAEDGLNYSFLFIGGPCDQSWINSLQLEFAKD